METVVVQLPGPTRDPILLQLRPGECLRFGRGGGDERVEVRLPHQGVSRIAGEMRATDDHWSLTNFSLDKTYVVENPEGAGEHIKVPPRRVGAPVPFELARVVLPAGHEFVDFRVFAPMHTYLDPAAALAPGAPDGERTLAAFPLDESSKYFLVLVALCEPRLRDLSPIAIPTVDSVVERLRPLPACADLTRAAVNFHIDYLARTKLRVRPETVVGPPERLDAKREALVSLALRFNLVREEHLGLLPSRRAATGRG